MASATNQTIAPFDHVSWRRNLPFFLLLALSLGVSAVVRIRLLNAPLERDEGEHAYLAQMILSGHAPWQTAYNLKLPGTDFLYAAFLGLFGQTTAAIRIGLGIVNFAIVLLVGLLGKRLFGLTAGLFSASAFALMSCSQGVLGTIAHSTHFVVFFALWATLIMLDAREKNRLLFVSGLLYGIAFLMKQPGLAFAAAGGLILARECRASRLPLVPSLKRGAVFALGVALPYAVLCLVLWRAGTFPRFWYWTVTLAQGFAAQLPLDLRFEYLTQGIAAASGDALGIWLLSALGIILALRKPGTRRAGLFLAVWAVLSFLAVSAGGVFRSHYFVLFLPAVALGCGAFLAAAAEAIDDFTALVGSAPPPRLRAQLSFALPLMLAILACAASVLEQRDYLFSMDSYDFARSAWGLNPFPEAIQIADYVRDHSKPDARVAVLGSEAEIYFYSHRQAATGYLFMYPLMEPGDYALDCQKEVIREIEAARPEYLVYAKVSSSWLAHPDSLRDIYLWADQYTKEYFDIEGVIDLVPGEPARYVWGRWASNYIPRSSANLRVYRRRQTPANDQARIQVKPGSPSE